VHRSTLSRPAARGIIRHDRTKWQKKQYCILLTTLSIEIPIHVVPIPTPFSLDERFLQGLGALRTRLLKMEKERWEIWQDAIIFSTRPILRQKNVRWQVEWVLTCAAFQRLVQTDHDKENPAKAFAQALAFDQGPAKSVDCALFADWLMEFQRLRGDFAHGKSQTQKSTGGRRPTI
jgi:hypothetical protein